MKKHGNTLYTSRFLIIFTLASLSIIAVSASLPSKKPQDDIYKRLDKLIDNLDVNSIKVTNRTSAFNIIQKGKAPEGHIRLTMRNDYNKSITAYVASIGSNWITADSLLSMHDESIKPGESTDVLLSIGSESKDEWISIYLDPELERKGIEIHAVIFEDGAADGQVESIKEIESYRIGDRMEMERFNSLLNDDPTASTAILLSKLSEIQTGVSSFSESTEKDLPDRVKTGIRSTRQRMFHLIKELDDKNESKVKAKLNILKEYVKEKTLMLRKCTELIEIKNQ